MVDSINSTGFTQGVLKGQNQAQDKQETALERLSSAKQLNSAADNAAGLAIVERFASQIDGASQAVRNASDAVSVAQVADASLSAASEDLQRIRELSVRSVNAALTDSDRANLQAEVSQLRQQVSDTLEQATVSGVELFTRSASVNFQVGADANDTIEVSTSDLDNELSVISSLNVSTPAAAQDTLDSVNELLQTLDDQRVDFGAVANRLESSISNLQSSTVSTQRARSQIEDTDTAKEVSKNIQGQIQQQSGIAVQSQANSSARLVLQLLS